MSNNALNVQALFLDSVGNKRAGGKVTFYVNKTTTKAAIYSNELLTVTQANPYTLDAAGRINGDVRYSGKMTVSVSNSDGSDVISHDDVESQGGTSSDAFADQFQATESSPQAMTVELAAGKVLNAETLVSVAAQTTTVITAPVTNPRIDRIVINRLTGVYQIVTGAEAASPTAPAIPVNTAPICQFQLATSTSVITDAMIVDERIPGIIESNVNSTETLTNKTLTSPVLTTPQINDTSADHQYVVAVSELAADRTITLPLLTGNDEITFNDHTQTLTNKTLTTPALTSPVMTTPQINDTSADHQYIIAVSELAADRTITFPLLTGNDELTFNAHTQTLTNKKIGDAAAPTKEVGFDLAGATALTTTTLDFNQTADRTITFPDEDGLLPVMESGTWTPELWDTTLATDPSPPTYTLNDGIYRRIGDLYIIQGIISISSLGGLTPGSPIFIGALPATSTTGFTSQSISAGSVRGLNITAGQGVTATVSGSANYIALWLDDLSTGQSQLLVSEFSSTGIIEFGGSYIAD
jgi:hypothetical protein